MNLSAAVKPIIFESHRGCWCYCWYFGFKKLEPISRSVVFATGRVFGMKNSRKTIFMMRFINFDTEVVNLSSLFPLSIWQLFFFPFLVVEKWKNECRPSFLQSTRTTHTHNWVPRREAKKSSTKLQLEFPRLLCQNSRPFRAYILRSILAELKR